MADNVLHLVPKEVGEGAVLDAKELLESALMNEWDRLVIIGVSDGEIEVRSTHGLSEALLLIERGKLTVL